MKLLFVPIVLAALGQGDDPAKIMKAMEDKIAKATTVQTDFDAKIESGKGNGTMKGTATVGTGGKARLDGDLEFAGMDLKLKMVSDGTKLSTTVSGMQVEAKDTPKHMRALMTVLLARAGIGVMLLAPKEKKNDDQEDPLEAVKLTDLKKVKTEKVGDRNAVVIEFKLAIKDQKATIAGSVWVDTQTNLPLKRVLRAETGGETATVTETYSNFRINPKIEDKIFELPK
jgi:outer membrane lipoprotein-sorting protein